MESCTTYTKAEAFLGSTFFDIGEIRQYLFYDLNGIEKTLFTIWGLFNQRNRNLYDNFANI
ncbi:hypothetical protein [Enterococcus hirae]|uniref:hypothetical protein n=1 Tax=Enterococcus hirae TaxID=1354 RepID=UPI000BA0D73C|nr:hypothetical protein [Enterococcus hirae]ASV80691.1 hypothetical protein A6J73_00290 [Enterococcus hirae]NAD49845.1 hypothetical protein [Enterococcus hirae]NAD79542.1 hypothetical protein [Enterococcus hirae]OZS38803.1 hypothetical protein CHB54_02390 [Enterococcus hirae]PWG76226.1 hypothetical protein DF186_08975 [Enterococcus hirae]